MARITLGIETSCDETAAALAIDGIIVSDRITRQILHEEFGGVVPELASRAHERLLAPAIDSVLRDSGVSARDINAVGATYGPGLAGALLVGVSFAKGLSTSLGIPFYPVNHLEGHIWSFELSLKTVTPPFLALIISGGHTLLVKVNRFGNYSKIAGTRDDAVGELFDKVGRMLGFPFPSGEFIDNAALDCKSKPIRFPRSRFNDNIPAFSFSGLKTAVMQYLKNNHPDSLSGSQLDSNTRNAICLGIMQSVGDMLSEPVENALENDNSLQAMVIGGGVAASHYLRTVFQSISDRHNIPLLIPPINHCTDNGSMVVNVTEKMLSSGYSPAAFDQPVNPSASLFEQLC